MRITRHTISLRIWAARCGLTMLLLLPIAAAMADAPPAPGITPLSGNAELADLKQYYEIPDFKIGGKYNLDDPNSFENGGEGGVTLESLGAGPLRTAYIDLGTPRRNEQGEIVNAVIVNAYYSGDAATMYNFWVDGQKGNGFSKGAVIGPGKLIDTDKVYVVLLDALGLWGASKPSDGLGLKFPQYSYYDIVQANYRLLRDHLKVAKVQLATGVSMGATQTWVWGIQHPEFVDYLMPIGGTTASDTADPTVKWTFDLATAAIQGDPVWQATGGDYYDRPKAEHPNQGVAFSWSVLGLTGLSLDFRSTQDWEAIEPEVFFWEPEGKESASLIAKAKDFDAIDLLYRNECGNRHNVNDELHRIQDRMLVVHVKNDQWLVYGKAEQAVWDTAGAEIVGFPSPLAHYAVFAAPNLIAEDPLARGFFDEAALAPAADKLADAGDYQVPRVIMEGDADKSFWKDQLVPPYEVKYETGKDSRGVEWEIGYMDEYTGTDPDPQVLMIIHGKGAFGAHYGNLMRYALEQGLRVVVPDMPHYGMSGPGNLDKSIARTLQDARDAIHDVVVDQLGVDKAYCLGHSLGGQFCLGYALSYPDNVTGLVLEGPAGLEEFPKDVEMGEGKTSPMFDPSYAHDFDKWKEVWGPQGLVQQQLDQTPQDVMDFFYFKKRDPDTGAVSDVKAGYFKRDSEYARLHTKQRIAMIDSNPAEMEQWANIFIYDVYSIGSELNKGDPDSLYSRLDQIEVPIFVAFGAVEPFIPTTALNGLESLANDVIVPFTRRMTAAGNKPVVKVYPNVGHFIHTDVPLDFAKDSVDFIRTGQVDVMAPDVVDFLIHPPAAAASGAGAGGAKKAGGAFSK